MKATKFLKQLSCKLAFSLDVSVFSLLRKALSTATLLFFFLLGTTVSAQLIVYESFNYTLNSTSADPDGGVNGGSGLPYTNVGGDPSGTSVGLKNNYSTDHTVVAGLTYNNAGGILVSANNAIKRTSGSGNSEKTAAIYKGMVTDPFQSYRAQNPDFMGWNSVSGAKELYLSVLLNASAVNTGTKCGLLFNIGHNGTYNVETTASAIKQSGANWVFQGIPGTENEMILGAATANETAFFVIKYSFLSATAFKAECWMNPVLGVELGTPTATYNKTDLTSGADFRSIQTQNGANVLTYDEFRLGVTAADVMPCSQVNVTASSANISSYNIPSTGSITVASGNELVVNQSKTLSAVTVSEGAKLSVASGQTLTLTNLTLKSSASGTSTFVNDGTLTLTGTAVVEQYLATTRNWYVSSPVTNANAPAGYTYYKRNEAGSSWTPVSAGTGLIAGIGYIALPETAGVPITFTTQGGGTLNSGNITIPVTYTPLATSAKGFNLIGNPYPAHLTWTKTFVDNNASLIEPSIYYRTNAGSVNNGGDAAWSFKTYNASTNEFSPAGTTNIIPPMQAFWIRAKASGNLILNSDLTKSHQSSNPLKAPAMNNSDRQRVRLQVSNGTRTDETVLIFDANAADGYDVFDSPKFAEANSEVQIYTTIGTEKMVINGMKNMPLNQEIALGFVPGSANSFILKANEISNLPTNVRLILKDNVTKAETDLTDGVSTYQFGPEASSESRFSLLFRAPGATTGIDNGKDAKVTVFVNAANQITIIAPESSNYAIYNTMGQLIENGVLNSQFTIHNSKLNAGVYVVRVGNESKRVIVKE